VNLVLVGHVDHGKSTLLARLLVDTGAVPENKLSELEAICKRRSSQVELSFLLDAFQIERDQAISIDSTRVWFSSKHRRYAVADAPGHFEFLRHVVTGAADASLAVLVVNALAGPSEQTGRHAAILSLVGINNVLVAVNKMDLVAFSRERFEAVRDQAESLLANHRLSAHQIVPTAALEGDNVVRHSDRTPWYKGETVLEALDRYEPLPARNPPLRLPVQDVYRRDSERLVAGNLQGGPLAEGDLLVFSPPGLAARVATIRRFGEDHKPARHGEAIALALDRDIFVEPGYVASRAEQAPYVTSHFGASIFWFWRTDLLSGSLNSTPVPQATQTISRSNCIDVKSGTGFEYEPAVYASPGGTWSSNDNPGFHPINTYIYDEPNQSFTDYFLYQSYGGYWVTVATLNWSWHYEASRALPSLPDSEAWPTPVQLGGSAPAYVTLSSSPLPSYNSC
jgi:bifunctional enzyme CysN/CysC